MNIAGIIKSSFIDYPGCASTVIFLGGCNFNCGYCHNPEIVHSGGGEIEVSDFLDFVEKRRRFVDAVCISGGEPTLYGGELYQLILRLKELGYKVKLDTNGTNPALLRRLLGVEARNKIGAGGRDEAGAAGGDGAGEELLLTGPRLLDHVAMDIKGPWEKYEQIAGLAGTSCGNGGDCGIDRRGEASGAEGAKKLVANVRESLELLLGFGRGCQVEARSMETPFTYELRTTVCRELLSKGEIQTAAAQLDGADCWYLQTFKQQGELLDPRGNYSAYTAAEMEELRQAAESVGAVKEVRVRG